MTNELANQGGSHGPRVRLPQSAYVPDPPPELARAVRITEGEASDRYLPVTGDVSISQAEALIPAYAAADQPVARAVIEGWLDRVALGVVNAPDLEGPKPRVAAILALSGELPRLCWTMETWQAFLRRGPAGKFWPAAAEVDGFLRPTAEEHRAKLATLRRIAAVDTTAERPATAPDELVSEAARMTLAERDAAIAAIPAKHDIPRAGAGHDDGEGQGPPPPVRAVPVDAATF